MATDLCDSPVEIVIYFQHKTFPLISLVIKTVQHFFLQTKITHCKINKEKTQSTAKMVSRIVRSVNVRVFPTLDNVFNTVRTKKGRDRVRENTLSTSE